MRLTRHNLALLAAAFLATSAAHADWISEFGLGVKLPTSSVVLLPECDMVALIPGSQIYNERGARPTASCGGSNPIFVGWPIAYERDFGGPWRVRGGWFHISSIKDGHGRMADWLDGDDRETHMDCLCMTATFNWSRRKR